MLKFKISTRDIQMLDIALIMYEADGVITEDDKNRLQEKLTELNRLCNKSNGFTLDVTVNG